MNRPIGTGMLAAVELPVGSLRYPEFDQLTSQVMRHQFVKEKRIEKTRLKPVSIHGTTDLMHSQKKRNMSYNQMQFIFKLPSLLTQVGSYIQRFDHY